MESENIIKHPEESYYEENNRATMKQKKERQLEK